MNIDYKIKIKKVQGFEWMHPSKTWKVIKYTFWD